MSKIKYISAGAGSGKTTKIVNELVRFISQENVKPSEVIMTTYTIAAAQEMRERARKGLLEAGLTQQASELDAAAIGTVHAICLAMVQKYWYLLGLSPELRQLEENDLSIYTNKSIDKLVDEETIQWFEKIRRELDISKYEDNVLIGYINYWRDALKTIVEKARYYEVTDLENSCQESIAEIDRIFSEHPDMDAIHKAMDEWSQYLSGLKDSQKRNTQLRAIEAAISHLGLNEAKDLLRMLQDPAGGQAAPDGSRFAEELNKWTLSEAVSTPLKQVVERLFGLAKEWSSMYVEYKRQYHLLDFNDMELYFYQLISNHDEAIKDIQAHYRLLMVDEFQDCNPIQLRIFNRLAEIIDSPSLSYSTIWVGDPKQAIYSFRGSDTDLVQRATTTLSNREALEYSWRSRPALIEWTNSLFLTVFENMGLNPNEITLRFPEHQKTDSISSDVPAIVRWKTQHESHAYYIAQGVLKLHEKYAWKNIAILLRTNAKIDQVVEAMRNRGIPVLAPEKDIISRAEVQLLVALLEYTNAPKYRTHLKADILHLIKNQTTEELLNDYLKFFVDNDPDQQYSWKKEDELIMFLDKTAYTVAKRGYYAQLTTFVDSLRLYDLVAQWGEAEIRRQNIITMLNIAQKYDNHIEQMDKEADFADFMQYFINSDIHPTQTPDLDAVHVTTYHRAKGLEWPVVILEDLDRDELKNLINYEYIGTREIRHEDNTYHIRFFPPLNTTSAIEEKMKSQPYYQASQQRVQQEISRLLYVGVTRAKELLILDTQEPWKSQGTQNTGIAWLENVTGKTSELLENFIQDTGVLEETILLPENFNPNEPTTKEVQTYTIIDTKSTAHAAATDEQGRVLTAHVNPSRARIPQEKPNVSTIQLNRTTLPFYINQVDGDGPTVCQSLIGTCIHNIYAIFSPTDEDETAIEKAHIIIESFGLTQVLNTTAIVSAIRSLYQYLTETYGNAIRIAHEVPFSMSTPEGQIVRGDIDLLWYTSDDRCVLVDFKNIAGDTPNPDHYYGQMASYQAALQSAGIRCQAILLYYASIGSIVKMEAN